MRGRALPRLKPLDFALFAAAAALASVAGIRAVSSGAASSVRLSDGERAWLYPVSEDRVVSVEGPLGATVVEIRGGEARVLDSPCDNKTCVASAPVSEPGQWIACLPNRVLVSVEGKGGGEAPDAIVR